MQLQPTTRSLPPSPPQNPQPYLLDILNVFPSQPQTHPTSYLLTFQKRPPRLGLFKKVPGCPLFPQTCQQIGGVGKCSIVYIPQ